MMFFKVSNHNLLDGVCGSMVSSRPSEFGAPAFLCCHGPSCFAALELCVNKVLDVRLTCPVTGFNAKRGSLTVKDGEVPWARDNSSSL